MDTLEKAVVEKFRQLNQTSQQRVYDFIEHELKSIDQQTFDIDTWLARVKSIQISSQSNASELVNEVRGERDADILYSLGFGNSAGDSAG